MSVAGGRRIGHEALQVAASTRLPMKLFLKWVNCIVHTLHAVGSLLLCRDMRRIVGAQEEGGHPDAHPRPLAFLRGYGADSPLTF